jgi:zinc and cadmium transporter
MSTLVVYCIVSVVASLSGGWIPLIIRLTHRRLQIGISLVGGMILGVGMLHLIPHAYEQLGSLDGVVMWALAGFLLMFFLERFFHFHHHDAPDNEGGGDHDPHAQCDHDHKHDRSPLPVATGFSWLGAALGLTLHGLLDGVALAAAFMAEFLEDPSARWAGFGTFLAVVLHKPFDSLSLGTLMVHGKSSRQSRHLVNLLYALVLPIGVLLFIFAEQHLVSNQILLGRALALSAGTFLCIATSDLLPEVQFHSHDRFKLSLSLLCGVLLAYAIGFFESSGHEHHHSKATGHHAAEHEDDVHETSAHHHP